MFSFWIHAPDPNFREGAKIADVPSVTAVPTRTVIPAGFGTVTFIEVREGANGDSAEWPVIKTYLLDPHVLPKEELLDRLRQAHDDAAVEYVDQPSDQWYVWTRAIHGQLTQISSPTDGTALVALPTGEVRGIAPVTDEHYALLV